MAKTNLDKIMTERDKSSRSLAYELGIDYTGLWKMRKGQQLMNEEHIKKIASYFQITTDELLNYECAFAKEKPIIKEVPPTYYNILAGLELCSIAELEKIASIIDFLKHKKKIEAELPPNRKIVWGENSTLPKDKK